MANAERKEKATHKRREDARKKGQFARGAELPAALSFLGGLIVLRFVCSDIFNRLGSYIHSSANSIANVKQLTDADLHTMFTDAWQVWAFLALPIVLVGFVAVLAGKFAHGGLSFFGKSPIPKAVKINPAENIKRVFRLYLLVNIRTILH